VSVCDHDTRAYTLIKPFVAAVLVYQGKSIPGTVNTTQKHLNRFEGTITSHL
jgi:hypothetical protein